jgi:hypothetical protein
MVDILLKYGWLDCSKDSLEIEDINECSTLKYDFYLTHLRISTLLNQYNKSNNQIKLYLKNKSGLYFIYENKIYLKDKKFTSNRELDFKDIKLITTISNDIESDIIKYNLTSDLISRDMKLKELGI